MLRATLLIGLFCAFVRGNEDLLVVTSFIDISKVYNNFTSTKALLDKYVSTIINGYDCTKEYTLRYGPNYETKPFKNTSAMTDDIAFRLSLCQIDHFGM